VSSRTYLSIGDVLTLLREEFPDVTISKIRFLESQGLVNPERSPSGYRKFFEHDVERLRWVLRQQREHFLPLKVIRDRLADGDLDEGEGVGAPGAPGESVTNGNAAEWAEAGEPTTADNEAMARILADASRRAALLPDTALTARDEQPAGAGGVSGVGAGAGAGADAAAGAPVVPEDRVSAHPAAASRRQEERASAAAAATAAAAGAAGTAASARGADHAGGRDRPRERAADAESGAATPAPAPDAAPAGSAATSTPAGGARGQAAGPSPRPERAVPSLPTTVVSGASLTTEELCAASGLSADELAGLESFGLLEATMVAGLRTYDEDALTVANLAASFRAYGIEPRHLRQYRNAADREMGLIEQVVIPLLRQRNPESRQRAAAAAEQLATLGQSMRATLLRVALRRHLGG
jgi:DNA-binding transcriptional MerR regulator